ncbi:MAG: hypothetical protein WCO98_02725 [bacterium]
MNKRQLWSRILIIIGGTAMVVGALDPMEGSLLILPGSGVIALGTYLGKEERWIMQYRFWGFIMITAGVAALWFISMKGGLGGDTGRSMWWSSLFLPYLVGWSIIIWGPGSPRWLTWLGLIFGLFYLFSYIFIMMYPKQLSVAHAMIDYSYFGIIGILTIIGCIYRLLHQPKVSAAIEEKEEELQ